MITRRATKEEIERSWSLHDVLDACDVLDAYEAAEAESEKS